MKLERKWVAAVLVVAVVAVPVLVGVLKRDAATQVDLATVSEREVHPTILAPGTLAFRTEVNLTSELTARVATILIKEGDKVEKGQLLMTLDPELYRNAIDREEAGLRQRRITIERQRAAVTLRQSQFERSRKLLADQLIDQASYDETRNQLQVAKLELQSSEEDFRRSQSAVQDARQQLDKTTIRSPISGRVVSLPIKVGETAVPSTSSFVGAQLAKIADTSRIQAELKVDEADIARVSIGQAADVYAAAFPDDALKGKVEQIALAPTVEGQGRAYKVTVALLVPPKVELRSGMSVRAEISLGDDGKRPAVPVEAIVTEMGEDKQAVDYIWKVTDGKAKKVKVATGISDDAFVAVGKPLVAGDVIVRGPSRSLRQLQDGTRVEQRKAGSGDGDEKSDGKTSDKDGEPGKDG